MVVLWGLWFLVKWFVIILVAATLLDMLTRWLLPTGKIRVSMYGSTANSSVRILGIPGILADEEHLDPVMETLRCHGTVETIGYPKLKQPLSDNESEPTAQGSDAEYKDSQRFYPDVVAESIAQYIKSEYKDAKQITLVCTSMGGIVALDVLEQLKGWQPSTTIDLVLVDCINGSRNMGGGGDKVASALRWIPAGWFLNLFPGHLLMWAFRQPPKDAEIETGLDKSEIKRQAVEGLRRNGRYFSTWRDQMVYMHKHKLTPEMFARVASVTYISCESASNVTVKQPAEANQWQAVCEAANVPFHLLTVDVPHAAYLQQPTLLNQVLSTALATPVSNE